VSSARGQSSSEESAAGFVAPFVGVEEFYPLDVPVVCALPFLVLGHQELLDLTSEKVKASSKAQVILKNHIQARRLPAVMEVPISAVVEPKDGFSVRQANPAHVRAPEEVFFCICPHKGKNSRHFGRFVLFAVGSWDPSNSLEQSGGGSSCKSRLCDFG